MPVHLLELGFEGVVFGAGEILSEGFQFVDGFLHRSEVFFDLGDLVVRQLSGGGGLDLIQLGLQRVETAVRHRSQNIQDQNDTENDQNNLLYTQTFDVFSDLRFFFQHVSMPP